MSCFGKVLEGLKVEGSKAAQRTYSKMDADFAWSAMFISEATGHCNLQKSGWAETACRS